MFEFNFGNLFTATGFLAIAAAIVKIIAIPAVREFLCREKENIDEIVLKRNEDPEKTVDTFNHMIRKSLKSIDSLLGKPFSYNTFLFSTLLSIAYPIVTPFIFWVFTGENWSRVDGFAGYGLGNDFFLFRLLIFCLVTVFFAVLIDRRDRQIQGREEVKVFPNLYYFALLDAIITFGVLLGILYFDIPLLYLVLIYFMATFLAGVTRQYEMLSGLLVFITVLRTSIILTAYLILADILNWSHNDWSSISLIFILSFVVRLLQEFLAQLLAKLLGISLFAEKGNRLRLLIIVTLGIVLMLILNFALLTFGNINADKQMLRPLAALNVFLLFFPMVNAVFDYASFSFTRIFLGKYTSPDKKRSWRVMAKYFFLDLLAASLCLVFLTVCTAFGLSGFNHLFSQFAVGYQAVDIEGILSTLESNSKDVSLLWLYIMIFSTFVPTLLHVILFLTLLVKKTYLKIRRLLSRIFSRNDNASFERYISKLREYQPGIKPFPHEISLYITKRFMGTVFFHAHSHCIDCATCFVGSVRICGRVAVDTQKRGTVVCRIAEYSISRNMLC